MARPRHLDAETSQESTGAKERAANTHGLAADRRFPRSSYGRRTALASEGMPVRRQGPYIETTPDELNAWMAKQAGSPVHVATADTDLAAELKRGLAFVRSEQRAENESKTTKPTEKHRITNEEGNRECVSSRSYLPLLASSFFTLATAVLPQLDRSLG